MREITSKRNLHSKTFDLGNGKRMLRSGIRKPLHYINEQSKLEDIDLTPTLDRGQHFISKTSYKARIGRDFPGYRYTGARGTISAELVEINDNPVAKREPEYADKRFYWRGLSLGVDCTIIPRNAGLDALITIHDKNTPRKFTWEIDDTAGMMRPIVGRDALGRTLELEQEWSGGRLTITWTGKVIDGKWARRGEPLQEPKYPVWIDPTVNEAIIAGADDVWSFTGAGSDFRPNNTNLYMGAYSTGNYYFNAGLIFQTIAIPNSATINSAVLTIDILSITGTPSVKVYGNDVDDAAVWANPGNLPVNVTKTTAVVTINPSATGLYTIGVTGAAQEIVSRTGFASNNDIAFVLLGQNVGAGNDFASFAAYEHATRQEAQLDIVYTVAGGGATVDVAPFELSRFTHSPLIFGKRAK